MTPKTPVRTARQGYDAKAIEADVIRTWATERTRERVRKLRASGEPWYFVDGPPYTSGHIHLGTAWNKVMKDMLVRHRTMLGYNVRDQPGYDMHGLPIEVKVEKELGIENKKQIEELGVGFFVEKCRAFSLKFLADMTEEFKELGIWLDWDHPYRTVDDSYMEGAWWAIAKANERGLLYKDNRGGLPWCPRCETALAQAEVEYADRDDPSVYVKFKVDGRDESLVIWTTTPWTLPANMAIAAHPDLTYARVLATKRDGTTETIIVEESLVEAVAHAAKYDETSVLDHVPGRDLAGTKYVHPFRDEVPYHRERRSPAEYTVILGTHVAADRTGLVHTATGHGAEDFEVGKATGIAPFCPVGPDGRYTELAGKYKGLLVKKHAASEPAPAEKHADDVVIDALEQKGALLWKGWDRHSYGHCWRCRTPILYLTTTQWFLAVTRLKDKMLAEVARVKWTPEWAGASRQRDWVENIRDWCITRQRYWGIPVPIWECDACDAFEVVATKKDLLARSQLKEIRDLHRPWVDEVTMPCRGCRGTMSRIPDVLDVWFDSAVASWASLGYPGNEKELARWFPADLIIEGLDQTRGWFYSQLAAGCCSFGHVPYEEVVMHGFVHDQEGRPMSKSLGNIVAPSDVIQQYGVDALRWSLLETCAPWDDLHYGPDVAKDAQRALNILWNVHYFATQYMALDGYAAEAPDWTGKAPTATLDAWLVSRIQGLVASVDAALEVHEFHRAARAVERFVLDDLSRWYVRVNRDRAWKGSPTEKKAFYEAMNVALSTVARLMAPFAPHTPDAIWRDLHPDGGSVHEQLWPKASARLRDEALEADVQVTRAVVEAVSQAREKAGLSLRWPVPRIVLAGDATVARAAERLKDVLMDQCNAQRVEYAGATWGELKMVAVPDRTVMGPRLKGDAPKAMQAVREADAGKLKASFDTGKPVQLGGVTIEPTMVRFETEVPEGVLGASFTGGTCFVDAHLKAEHEAEGLSRELLRRIQEMRKEQDLDIEAVVSCVVEADDVFVTKVKPHVGDIAKEARVKLSFEKAAGGTEWTVRNPVRSAEEKVRVKLG